MVALVVPTQVRVAPDGSLPAPFGIRYRSVGIDVESASLRAQGDSA